MALRKSLVTLTVLLSLALLGAGCRDNTSTLYEGNIAGRHAKLTKTTSRLQYTTNELTITKKDGTKVVYRDNVKEDLKVDYLLVTPNGGKTTKYFVPNLDKDSSERIQEKFDFYMKRIEDIEYLGEIDRKKKIREEILKALN